MTDIHIPSSNGTITASMNAPDNTTSAVIVIHEVWGLTPHIKDVANRISELGYATIAPDLLSHTGIMEKMSPDIMQRAGDPTTRDEAQKEMRAAMAPLQSPEFAIATTERLDAIFDYLSGKGYSKIAVIGFCFGGTYSWSLAVARPKLAAALVFYGHAPHEDEMSQIKAPIFGFYGETDHGITGHLAEVKEAMNARHKQFEYVVYKDAGHAFFNDSNHAMYRQDAAEQSWVRAKAIFHDVL